MRTAVVTGAGRGIGREIARRLQRRGYAVLCTDVDAGAAEATAGQLGDTAWATALDVRDPEAHRLAAAEASARGPLEAWFNNAGVLRTAKAWEHSDDEVRLIVEANLLGVVYGTRAAIHAMRAYGGHIVNTASLSALAPAPGLAVYGATKHAVLGFTYSVQGDLTKAGIPIRIHALNPDAVETDMVREREGERDSAVIFSAPRMLNPGEVAEAAVELLDGDRIVRTLPASRGAIARATAMAPGMGLKTMALFDRIGDKRRKARLARSGSVTK